MPQTSMQLYERQAATKRNTKPYHDMHTCSINRNSFPVSDLELLAKTLYIGIIMEKKMETTIGFIGII